MSKQAGDHNANYRSFHIKQYRYETLQTAANVKINKKHSAENDNMAVRLLMADVVSVEDNKL